MTEPTPRSRRSFLGAVAASGVATTYLGGDAFALNRPEEAPARFGPNDKVRLATVGMGIIGFIDTDCALKVPGVELVAAADLYAGRRDHVKEVYGDKVKLYTDYREILARDDIDAVLLCVPDHWHAKMAIDAMHAKKAVYVEKPMVRTLDEGPAMIAAQRSTGAVVQVGSQYASSLLYDKVRDLIKAGTIGAVNSIEARYNRNSAIGAWQYSIPVDASPTTVDFDRFLGDAPKRPYDPLRFFRWRNYWDYGTAVAGDLFVHLLTGIHHATGALGPDRVAAFGGQRYWKDGRDVYDIIMGLLDYPETPTCPSFTLSLQSNFEDGGGDGALFRFVGSEGVISVSFTSLTVSRVGIEPPTADQVLKGYNSVRTFSDAGQAAFAAKYRAEHAGDPKAAPKGEGTTYSVPRGYDERLDHMKHFFASARGVEQVYEGVEFGYRAAAPALLCNTSYREGRMVKWDAAKMRAV